MLASLSKKLDPITNSAVGKIVGKIANSPITEGLVLAGGAALVLVSTGNGEVLLNAVDSTLIPLVGSLANNATAQVASLVVEAGLAAGALKSMLWGTSRIRQAGILAVKLAQVEQENNQFRVKIQEFEKLNLRADELKKQATTLKGKATKLGNKATELGNKENALNSAQEQLDKNNIILAEANQKLAAEQLALVEAQKEENTKAHNNAKKQKELEEREQILRTAEESIKDKERANEDLSSDLTRLKLEVEAAEAKLQKDQDALAQAQQQFVQEQEAYLSQRELEAEQPTKRTARDVLLPPSTSAIKVGREGLPVLTGFDAARKRQTGWEMAVGPHSSDEDLGSEEVNRSRSPSRSPTH